MTRLTWLIAVIVMSAALVFSSVPASAQDDSPAFWGPGPNFHFVGAEEFQSRQPDVSTWAASSSGFWYIKNGSGCTAAVRLPTGALVTGMTVIYRDEEPDVDRHINVNLRQNWVTEAGAAGTTPIIYFESSGAPGITSTWVDIDPDHTIKYIDGSTVQSYVLNFSSGTAGVLELRGVIIHWNRQVSPAPVTATFTDVPVGSFGFRHIEALAASGITAGCGSGYYCPEDPVTREQMAVFLSKALGLHWPN